MDEENNQQNNQNEERGEAKQSKKGKVASFAVSLGKVIGGIGTPADWINVLKVAIPCFLASLLITIALWSAIIGVFVQPLYEFEKWTSELWGKVEGSWNNLVGTEGYTDKEQDLLDDMERYDIEGRDDTDDYNSVQLDGDVPFDEINNYYEEAFGYNHRLNQIYNQYKKQSSIGILHTPGVSAILDVINNNLVLDALITLVGLTIQDLSPESFGYDNEIDISIIQAVLFNNRLGGNLLNEDNVNEFYQKVEADYKYYAIHSKGFKTIRENAYFDQMKNRSVKDMTNAIEVLAKHQIVLDLGFDVYAYKETLEARNMSPQTYTMFLPDYMIRISVVVHEIEKIKEEINELDEEGNPIIDEEATEANDGEIVYKKTIIEKNAREEGVELIAEYNRDCSIFKDYLQGTGNYQGYPQNFIDSYYKEHLNESKTRQDMIDQIYDYAYWYQKSSGRYSYCIEEEYIESDDESDFSCEPGLQNGATGLCNYEDYTIELYDCNTGATTITGLSWGQYLSGVTVAEVGKIASSANANEIVKANMIIAKTYAIYNLNKKQNGASVDDTSKTIRFRSCGSGGFQAYKKDDRYAGVYPEVQDQLLLQTNGSVFNANYAACNSNSKGIQNILYAFAGLKPGNKADARELMPNGYESYSYSQIIDFIIKTGATNYKCSIDNYYNNATLGMCPESGYIANVSFREDPNNKIYDASNKEACTGYVDNSTYNALYGEKIVSEAKKIFNKGITYSHDRTLKEISPGIYTGTTDCSGYSKYVYEKAIGYSINKTAASQAKQSNAYCVKESDLMPGDLVFFGKGADDRYMQIGHVGIYYGNGQIIDMGSSNNGISIRNIWDDVVMYTRPYAGLK